MSTGSSILLPRIKRVELRGFQPLFEETIAFSPPAGPFLILGGNALGKTTILQATVFAIAGAADSDIEDEKRFRWSTDYFKKRLIADTDAEVEVEFTLGKLSVSIRRGIKPDRIRGVRFNSDAWLHDGELAPVEYESTVTNVGRYASFDDFRYVVHRLCYLAENRRNLLWDQRAQLRTVMLVCGDAAKEADYYRIRRELTSANTDMRHRHVDITHLEARILRVEQTQKPKRRPQSRKSQPNIPVEARKISELESKVSELIAQRVTALGRLRSARASLQTTTSELEQLQEQLSRAEDAFVLTVLRETESAANALGLHKLLIHHRCPYCAQVSESLAHEARRRVGDGECPLCGQAHITQVSQRHLQSLRQTVASRTQERDAQENDIAEMENVLMLVTQDEIALRAQLDVLAESLPRVPREEAVEFTTDDIVSLRRTLRRYRADHAKLEARCTELKAELESRFDGFRESSARNIRRLQQLASEYGTAFLGDKCDFVQTPAPGELHSYSFFVPRFAEEDRTEPDNCSESERFFLDIAFRMALIALAGQLAHESATFICETPESALDLAYTDNVAGMFLKFARKSFSLLLTANIQAGGVALPILRSYPRAQRPRHILNLIDRVTLTTVQTRKKADFKKELRNIMEGQS